ACAVWGGPPGGGARGGADARPRGGAGGGERRFVTARRKAEPALRARRPRWYKAVGSFPLAGKELRPIWNPTPPVASRAPRPNTSALTAFAATGVRNGG